MNHKYYRPKKSEFTNYFKGHPSEGFCYEKIIHLPITTKDVFELVTTKEWKYTVYCKEKQIFNGYVNEERLNNEYVPIPINYNKFWTKFNEN